MPCKRKHKRARKRSSYRNEFAGTQNMLRDTTKAMVGIAALGAVTTATVRVLKS